MTGYIKNIVREKGFGFIACDDQSEDLFFHFREIVPPLEWNEQLTQQRVQFEAGTDPRSGRMRAFNVRPAN